MAQGMWTLCECSSECERPVVGKERRVQKETQHLGEIVQLTRLPLLFCLALISAVQSP